MFPLVDFFVFCCHSVHISESSKQMTNTYYKSLKIKLRSKNKNIIIILNI